ncbi:sigma-54 interaction domain-containing protein [Pelagibaculum spongiae]|uniref:Sigma-54 factor interaction domain-containing protein n=1 Tax=Pelagibaculum spongiae TaxID=2080658 RepID=A0A2V1GZN1_9GAMM|nr:sigma 54-interacting transcriptional regulator [Pelagibaculum spongiae]PVZ68781.1 hypothetical protein DC094_11020 [Pelagibaculum spongiae]
MSLLGQLLSITTANEHSVLAKNFCQTLASHYQLMAAHFIVPSANGRLVETLNHPQCLDWKVDDFEHPFSHVLRNDKAMLLERASVPYWRSNNSFAALLGETRLLQQVLIQPIHKEMSSVKAKSKKKLQGILVLIAADHNLTELNQQQDFNKFCQIFSQQWQVLVQLQQQNTQKKVLACSIEDLQQQKHSQQLQKTVDQWLIGQSQPMLQMKSSLVKAAQTELSILLQGATGTGKELAARAIHHSSTRSNGPFLAINCAAIPENLLESELFGYEKGAFSGADFAKRGLLAEANGGSLLLDEIGDMPLSLQAKLLRVLESKSFRPLGGKQEQATDFRLIAATHVQLRAQVETKGFRADLFYRINQYPLYLPDLSQRTGDIPILAQAFIEKYNQEHNRKIRGISFQAIDYLQQYDFPGNVRELRNLIAFACTETSDNCEINCDTIYQRMSMGDFNFAQSVARKIMSQPYLKNQQQHDDFTESFDEVDNLKLAVQQYETAIIRAKLRHFNGSRAKAAASLGMPKRTLAHKCLKLEIS